MAAAIEARDKATGSDCLSQLFKTKPVFSMHFDAVQELMTRLERQDFGEAFGLFLHCELHLVDGTVHLIKRARGAT